MSTKKPLGLVTRLVRDAEHCGSSLEFEIPRAVLGFFLRTPERDLIIHWKLWKTLLTYFAPSSSRFLVLLGDFNPG